MLNHYWQQHITKNPNNTKQLPTTNISFRLINVWSVVINPKFWLVDHHHATTHHSLATAWSSYSSNTLINYYVSTSIGSINCKFSWFFLSRKCSLYSVILTLKHLLFFQCKYNVILSLSNPILWCFQMQRTFSFKSD